MANQEGGDLASQLVDLVKEISGLPECRNVIRKMYGNLMRRVKLLSPLFEELKDNEQQLDDADLKGLHGLIIALNLALELLISVNDGSKIFQALQIEKTAGRFHSVSSQIEEALSQIHYENFELSEEVHEQIELVHVQFKRAKEQIDSPDLQLQKDLAMVGTGNELDLENVKRLSEKLSLIKINDLKKESIAIHDMITTGGYPEVHFEMMSFLLKKIKDFVMLGNPEVDIVEGGKTVTRHQSPVIPDDFRCPISLDLMKDPVILSSGQTYERASIQKWLDRGHKTCPKTQQTLLHTTLTPNYVLKSLISLWCDSNGIKLPKASFKPGRRGSDCDRAIIGLLLQKIVTGDSDEQRSAAGELRLLARRNADNGICIAEAGAIPLLVELLSSRDSRTQEHAVTALLNLSINDASIDEANKGIIVSVGAIPEMNTHYQSLQNSYNALHRQHGSLQNAYNALYGTHSSLSDKLSTMETKISHLQRRFQTVFSKTDSLHYMVKVLYQWHIRQHPNYALPPPPPPPPPPPHPQFQHGLQGSFQTERDANSTFCSKMVSLHYMIKSLYQWHIHEHPNFAPPAPPLPHPQ